MTSQSDVQNVPDVWALLEQARDSIVELERAFVMSDYQKGLIATLSAALAQRDQFVLVPKEPTQEMVNAYWTSPGAAAFNYNGWNALLAAAPKPDGKP